MTILNAIKDALTKTASAPAPFTRDLTQAKVEALTVELKDARLAEAQAEQAVGYRLVEGLDVTAATDAMKQASDRVRVLESALAVAIQQDAAAQTELRHAKRHASIEAECAALADLKIIGLRGDQLFETVTGSRRTLPTLQTISV